MIKKIFIYVLLLNFINSKSQVISEHIKVDQFGYLTTGKKIAIISDPQAGYNVSTPYTPDNTYRLRRESDSITVFISNIQPWNNGSTHSQSGDKVWWFDFSNFVDQGTYYVYDSINNTRSFTFDIDACVYNTPLVQAMRTFYYQRCGIAKTSQHAGGAWADAACHIASQQDTDCRLYNNTSASTSKNLSGGWHDAGDYNKYVNFAFEPIMDLLLAYDENAVMFTDDYNIPESGNSIPDLLDEVKYELDWLLKMQNTNGSVLSVIGGGSASPPSADLQARRYGPATTSATFTAAASFALGAIEFKKVNQTAYATVLEQAAINAWTWANANPNITFYNSGTLAAGEQEVDAYGTFTRQISAAIFLYALTGNATYKTFVENNYTQCHLLQWTFAYPFENGLQNALLYYSRQSNITSSVATAIKNAFANSVKNSSENFPSYSNKTDAYRAYLKDNDYTWGSNTTKARMGIIYNNMVTNSLDLPNNSSYNYAANGFVNYFHGVNPTHFCYLSNMNAFGAENSINEFYHAWFADGSALWDRVGASTYGPAPGFISGGPNPSYALDGCCPSSCGGQFNAQCNTANLAPPLNQPIQKSYKDWNTSWPQNSWTVTENGIYTEASYVFLLSKFTYPNCQPNTIEKNISNKKLIISPNPTSVGSEIQLKSANENGMIKVYSAEGNEVFSTNINNSGMTTIKSTALSSGIYIIILTTDSGSILSQKLLIQ